jgi:hypothetical protein
MCEKARSGECPCDRIGLGVPVGFDETLEVLASGDVVAGFTFENGAQMKKGQMSGRQCQPPIATRSGRVLLSA